MAKVDTAKVAKSNYFKDVGKELKKVNYPSVEQVRRNTIIVIVLSIVVGIFIAILDFGFGKGAEFLINNGATNSNQTSNEETNANFHYDENGQIDGFYNEDGSITPINIGGEGEVSEELPVGDDDASKGEE